MKVKVVAWGYNGDNSVLQVEDEEGNRFFVADQILKHRLEYNGFREEWTKIGYVKYTYGDVRDEIWLLPKVV